MDDTLLAMEDGVIARCTCGWQSGLRISGLVASALFREHQANPEAPEPQSLYDVARDLCHEHGMTWTDPRTGKHYPPPPRDKEIEDDGT